MEALRGETEKSLASLEVIFERGLCVPGNQLEEDTDFSAIRETERFQKLAALNKIRRRERIARLSPKLKMPFILHDDSVYVVYFLHGNTRNGPLEHRVFSRLRSLKDTMYFPDAPEQDFLENSYLWDDEEICRRYIADIIENHQKQTRKKIILAGFSRGARTALKLVYENRYPVDGVIAYAPAAPVQDIDTWDFLLDTVKVPAEIIVGENDDISRGDCETLLGLMHRGHIPARLTVIPGGGHDYKGCFEQYFMDALDRLKGIEPEQAWNG